MTEGISLTGTPDMHTAVTHAVRLGAANILIDALLATVDDELSVRTLRQLSVCWAPVSVADISYALTIGGDATDEALLVPVIQDLADLTLIHLTYRGGGGESTVSTLPWVNDALRERFGNLTDEHQHALAMRHHRFQQRQGTYEDLLEIPRHHAAQGNWDAVVDVAEQAARIVGGTLAVAAYLAETRPLIPQSERAWMLISDLAQQNFIAVGQLDAAARIAGQVLSVAQSNADTDPDQHRMATRPVRLPRTGWGTWRWPAGT